MEQVSSPGRSEHTTDGSQTLVDVDFGLGTSDPGSVSNGDGYDTDQTAGYPSPPPGKQQAPGARREPSGDGAKWDVGALGDLGMSSAPSQRGRTLTPPSQGEGLPQSLDGAWDNNVEPSLSLLDSPRLSPQQSAPGSSPYVPTRSPSPLERAGSDWSVQRPLKRGLWERSDADLVRKGKLPRVVSNIMPSAGGRCPTLYVKADQQVERNTYTDADIEQALYSSFFFRPSPAPFHTPDQMTRLPQSERIRSLREAWENSPLQRSAMIASQARPNISWRGACAVLGLATHPEGRPDGDETDDDAAEEELDFVAESIALAMLEIKRRLSPCTWRVLSWADIKAINRGDQVSPLETWTQLITGGRRLFVTFLLASPKASSHSTSHFLADVRCTRSTPCRKRLSFRTLSARWTRKIWQSASR